MKTQSLLAAVLDRTSIRDFVKEREIPKELLQKILLAGVRAPSAGNIQPRTIVLVSDIETKRQLYELCEDQAFMNDAPVWIVICLDLHRHLKAAKLTGTDYDFTGILPYTFGVLDAALSLENMVIAAEALGLGSVIIGSVIEHPEKAKKILGLPEHCLALSVLCVGYPRRKEGRRNKWDRSILVCENKYHDISPRDIAKYWEKTIASDLKRRGRKPSRQEVERIAGQRSYGKAYANHYREEFVRTTNRKLVQFLKKQGFLKD